MFLLPGSRMGAVPYFNTHPYGDESQGLHSYLVSRTAFSLQAAGM